jgi:DNA-binding transcriptional LysR family regulator
MLNDFSDQATVPHGPLHLSLRQLQAFVATARAGSTRGAGERLARSQSAASSALTELEAVLGTALFDRVGRRLRLNAQGQALLPRAVALLEQAHALEQLFRPEPTRAVPLRLAASLTIGEVLMPAWIAGWQAGGPGRTVRLRIANSSVVLEAVAAFEADLGFIEGPQTHPDLVVHPWLDDELVIVAAPGHPLAGRRVPPAALREAEWALRERGSGTRIAADQWLTEHLGPVRVALELGSAEALKGLVAAGAALACLSRRAVARELAELRTSLPPARRRLAWVCRRDATPGAAAQAFLALCRDDGPPPVSR